MKAPTTTVVLWKMDVGAGAGAMKAPTTTVVLWKPDVGAGAGAMKAPTTTVVLWKLDGGHDSLDDKGREVYGLAGPAGRRP